MSVPLRPNSKTNEHEKTYQHGKGHQGNYGDIHPHELFRINNHHLYIYPHTSYAHRCKH